MSAIILPRERPVWTTACPDWRERIVKRESLCPVRPLYPETAAAAMAVFERLVLADVMGQPTVGEAFDPWLMEFANAIFGSYDEESGRRLIRDFFLLVAKKNGKSTVAAAVMLTLLIINWRESSEMSILAPTKEVADNAFNPARDAIAKDERLSAILHVQPHLRQITHRGTKAVLKVVAADSSSAAGKKSAFVFVDELWIFGKREDAPGMFTEALGGLVSRPEGCVIWASTQSDQPPAGVFLEKLTYARRVRDGEIVDPKFLPMIYEFPEAMIKSEAYKDPANFYIPNPNFGRSVDEEAILDLLNKAENSDDQAPALASFYAKHLNVQIGQSLRAERWAGADFWEEAGVRRVTFEELLARSEVIVAGVDGGGLDDLLGVSLIGREKDTGHWLHWAHAWAHEIVLTRRKSEASKFKDFEKEGTLTIVKKPGQDVDDAVARLMQAEETGLLADFGVDPAGIGSLVDKLQKAGIESERIKGVPQGWKLNGAILTIERKVAGGEFFHGGTSLMAYCVGNAKAEKRGNAVIVTKQLAGAAKIDPLMATFNAGALMMLNPESRKREFSLVFI